MILDYENEFEYEELPSTFRDGYVDDWYLQTFPDDKLGVNIAHVKSSEVYQHMLNKEDVYEILEGDDAIDSVIRERIFSELANRLNKDYDYVYDLWLSAK